MRVIRLQSENFMRLRAVDITPTGDVVRISGANGAGKTSILDSVWAALELARLNLDEPIHKGAKKARLRLNLGEITVERVITAKGNTLTVTAADGAKLASPQKFLDALIGELSFDPLAFERMKPREQFDALRAAVDVGIDFDALDRENQADFDRRTALKREAKAKQSQAEAIPLPRGDLPTKPVDEQALLDELGRAAEHNDAIAKRRQKRASVEIAANRAEQRAQQLVTEIARMEKEAAECNAEVAMARKRLAEAQPLPDPIDVSATRERHRLAQDMNRRIAERNRRRLLEAEATTLESDAEILTNNIELRNEQKQKAIAAAKMPVEGIGFGDGVVLYRGVPFHQASSAEKLRVSLGIAMAANPKLRVIRIQDGSLLDSKSYAAIGELAKANDFQVWVEVVDETGKLGIVIEDGEVVAVNE